MGGTLAWYAECGVAVFLVCATRGEAGEVDPHHLSGYGSVAERREAELRCAAEALGLTEVFFLGYRDSGMTGSPDNQHPQALAAAPLDEVTARVTWYIRRLRPHVVLTFDPIGGYRHPDHLVIHQATVQAFHAASDASAFPGDEPPYQPQKLYFHTFPRLFLRLIVRTMPLFGKDPRRFGRNHDIDLTSIAVEDFPTHAQIDYLPVESRHAAAVRCHASQGGGSGLLRETFGWALRLVGSGGRDTFMRAYPPPTAGLRERDLFAGVEIDMD
ncbi:MAG: GlcNAc-PI de-N-acetylase [Chloroflexaceae bacterium]|nr:GlcNAc-PI de-N-acetylase [Chloroflexaceae bacterium]